MSNPSEGRYEINEENYFYAMSFASLTSLPLNEVNEVNEITADDLWLRLVRSGFALTVDGDALRVSPASRLDASTAELIRRLKPALLVIAADPNVLLRDDWFRSQDPELVRADELRPAQLYQLGRCGRAYQVQASPLRPTSAVDLPTDCRVPRGCCRLGPCGTNGTCKHVAAQGNAA